MKIIWKLIKICIAVCCIFILLLFATGNDYIIRGARLTYLKGHKTANIDDYKDFDNNLVLTGHPQPWTKHPQYNQIEITDTLQKELVQFKTASFVVIKDNQLLIEKYYDPYNDKSITNSFSMAKSITTMLLGKAIEQGFIKSLDQKIIDFLPEFEKDKFGKYCTVGDLSRMTSGFEWEEDYYFPLNPTAKSYYGDDIKKQMLSNTFKKAPGGHFEYLSGDTQLLAIVLERATGKSLSQYFSDNFWKPMGMEQDAYWSKDRKDGMEKAFCCYNATAKDFAKLGQLLLNKGQWNGKQILASDFVEKMITPNTQAFDKNEPVIYGYSIWTDLQHSTPFYAMLGHLGQRVIMIPSENLVIVRLGKEKDTRPHNRGVLKDLDIYYLVDEELKMNQKILPNE